MSDRRQSSGRGGPVKEEVRERRHDDRGGGRSSHGGTGERYACFPFGTFGVAH